MLRKILTGKIHRAQVTGADISYMGSITIDLDLMEAAGIMPLQEVEVWNVSNGERFSTYAIPGKRGKGDIIVNGAAARRAAKGDIVIIASYGYTQINDNAPITAKVVMLKDNNQIKEKLIYKWDPDNSSFELKEG